jgi:acyl-CoA synthetase (AMP-forming)/AMP-acid ligase II
VALNGAEAVAPDVLRAFCARFARWGFRPEALTPVYGLSEAALAVTFSDLEAPFRVPALRARPSSPVASRARTPTGRELVSVGRPLPGFAVRIAGEDGRDLAPARVGRVLVQGPSLMDGYLGRPEATAAALAGAWLDTGDLGFLVDGELYLTGRKKDILILRGRNHAPEEVEHAVEGIAGLRAGCVVAVSHLPEGDAGERLLLFVERARDTPAADAAALADACRRAVLTRANLEVGEVHILPPGTLPRTSSGKLRRGETLARHLAGDLTPPLPLSPLRLASALLRSRRALRKLRRGVAR